MSRRKDRIADLEKQLEDARAELAEERRRHGVIKKSLTDLRAERRIEARDDDLALVYHDARLIIEAATPQLTPPEHHSEYMMWHAAAADFLKCRFGGFPDGRGSWNPGRDIRWFGEWDAPFPHPHERHRSDIDRRNYLIEPSGRLR